MSIVYHVVGTRHIVTFSTRTQFNAVLTITPVKYERVMESQQRYDLQLFIIINRIFWGGTSQLYITIHNDIIKLM